MAEKQDLTVKQIINELNKYIIGQDNAKRSVALALRNRWRRMRLQGKMRREVTPKNILMIGPTGVGKTEIARRLAIIVDAPFIKVEATKFTEVGYVGRDVESIVRDLANVTANNLREQLRERVKNKVKKEVEERILDALMPRRGETYIGSSSVQGGEISVGGDVQERDKLRQRLRAGELDDEKIDVQMQAPNLGIEIMGPPGMEEISNQLQSIFRKAGGGMPQNKRRIKVSEARRVFTNEAIDAHISEEDLKKRTVEAVEQNGIVFLDEIDKIAQSSDGRLSAAGVSREGVQRDLLPIIEGSSVKTRYGMIKTDYILFIASGSFHLSAPSDLVPELQGRLPVRVNLRSLEPDDMERILKEPNNSLILQYKALLATEGLYIEFEDSAVRRIAEIAWEVNENTENIGARRLQTLMEKLLEDVSFSADKLAKKYSEKNPLTIDAAVVEQQLGSIKEDKDLSKYVL